MLDVLNKKLNMKNDLTGENKMVKDTTALLLQFREGLPEIKSYLE